MTETAPTRSYRSYMLRYWQSGGQEATDRFVLECVSGAPCRHVFSSFAELVEFLRAELVPAQGDETVGQE